MAALEWQDKYLANWKGAKGVYPSVSSARPPVRLRLPLCPALLFFILISLTFLVGGKGFASVCVLCFYVIITAVPLGSSVCLVLCSFPNVMSIVFFVCFLLLHIFLFASRLCVRLSVSFLYFSHFYNVTGNDYVVCERLSKWVRDYCRLESCKGIWRGSTGIEIQEVWNKQDWVSECWG